MKKLFLALFLFSAAASADPYYGYHGYGYGGGYYGGSDWWIAPAIIGGAAIIGSAISPAPQVMVQQPAPVYYPPVPRYEQVFDPYCNCYRTYRYP